MIVIAVLIGIVGLAIALVGMRPTAGVDPAGGAASTSKPVVALVLGIAGVLLFPLGVAGAALGFGALDDITASGGRLGGRGLAVAGIVVGLVVAGLWILGLTLGDALRPALTAFDYGSPMHDLRCRYPCNRKSRESR